MPADRADGPDAVLWDMDGTLVDSEKLWTVSIAETARWLGGELSAAARAAMVGGDMPSTLDILFDDLGLPRDPDRKARAQRWMTERTGELFAGGLEWRPGALEALRTVSAAGWPMALVTNTQRVLTEPALDGIGREFFQVSVCGDEVSRGKPAPDPYLRAAELLGVDPGRCLAVEDSPTGAQAAERAGAAVLVVPCEVPVPAGSRRLQRESLAGLSADDVVAVYRAAGSRPAA
ncbi:HAD family hydrolase [Pseudonocardia humida]|uniref:HAD family phosphatase n=1 Tax=Pseudonocardia humida TaxID=2800819 RepID=A0ABT0ZZ88_9PSEU|nr:HAD family phosphatase [Pseudonocardia humida]MCO1656047.1 HAD family phosphatase [Pseudonocardia humida]